MVDSGVLESALFQHLVGCDPRDLYNKLFQNMAGTMNDAVDTLQSNLLEKYKDESDKCDEIKRCCDAMRQSREPDRFFLIHLDDLVHETRKHYDELVHKRSRYYAEQLGEYYSQNIFYTPRHTSVSDVDSSYIEPDDNDPTPYPDVNVLFAIAEKLLSNIEIVDKAIEERKRLLEQVKEVKKKYDFLSQNVLIGNDLLKDKNDTA